MRSCSALSAGKTSFGQAVRFTFAITCCNSRNNRMVSVLRHTTLPAQSHSDATWTILPHHSGRCRKLQESDASHQLCTLSRMGASENRIPTVHHLKLWKSHWSPRSKHHNTLHVIKTPRFEEDRAKLRNSAGAAYGSQRLEYPLIKEYTLNYSRIPNMI